MEDSCSDYCNLKSHRNLQHLSLRECLPFEEFLAPPVDTCIVPECRGKLVDQHRPVAVTIYGLTGPRRATRLCLRCSKCNTVYNYSQYGRKYTDGEKLYNHRREYIEVSDTIYCERQLHELFCNLRQYIHHVYTTYFIVIIIFRCSLHSFVSFSGFSEVYWQLFFSADSMSYHTTCCIDHLSICIMQVTFLHSQENRWLICSTRERSKKT